MDSLLFHELKKQMLLPEKEIIINKAIRIGGKDAVLASITVQNGTQSLWLLYHRKIHHIFKVKPSENPTNRDIIERFFHATRYINLSEIKIQSHKLTVGSKFGYNLVGEDNKGPMKLQHFVEKNVDLSIFKDIEVSDITILACNFNEELPLAEISQPINDIVLKIAATSRLQYIGKTYVLPFGVELPDERLSFFDSESETERYFYVNKLSRYDIWADTNEFLENGFDVILRQQNFNDGQIAFMRHEYLEDKERECPEGYDFVVVEYETEDEQPLHFYETGYLDSEPLTSPFGSGTQLLDEDGGPHGLKKRYCILKTYVPRDYNGLLSIELLASYIKTDEEIIRV